ncbi:MAG: PD40 domain-containing protein, partial [Anaerolineales bacterium]|nr:PD40 domain-containing protein [Anaerolineales bacterium]
MYYGTLKIASKAVSLLTITVLLSSSVLASPRSVRAAPGDTTRVSVDLVGTQANNASKKPSISGDGRFIAFESDASNLIPNDTNASTDIFVKDRQTGEVTRVSVDSSGAQANEGSGGAAISNDGRYVAFVSDASNLVANDTNATTDVFLRDRQLGTTIRISVSSSGEQANDLSDFPLAVSSDGRFVAFNSDATNLVANDTNSATDVFVHDNQTGATERVSIASDGTQANSSSYYPSISANGQFVTFTSNANNLISGDTNNKADVFARDRATG